LCSDFRQSKVVENLSRLLGFVLRAMAPFYRDTNSSGIRGR
jgi:hypothetical protein